MRLPTLPSMDCAVCRKPVDCTTVFEDRDACSIVIRYACHGVLERHLLSYDSVAKYDLNRLMDHIPRPFATSSGLQLELPFYE